LYLIIKIEFTDKDSLRLGFPLPFSYISKARLFLRITSFYYFSELFLYKIFTIDENKTANPLEFLLSFGSLKASKFTKQHIAKKNNKAAPATEMKMQ